MRNIVKYIEIKVENKSILTLVIIAKYGGIIVYEKKK